MGNKIITEKDFWMCTGGNVPAQLQSTQLSTKKKDGKKYITLTDTATSSMMDFGCNKLMLIMAIVAAVIAVCVVATGGAALIAIGALAGAAGAAVGAVVGGLICGQIAALARKWGGSKNNMIIQGKPAITGNHKMQCMLFGDEISFAPNIKNWWQAISLGGANYIGGIMEGMLAGAAVGMGGAMLKGGFAALAEGGASGLARASLNVLKSIPANVLQNIGATFGYAGGFSTTSVAVAGGLRGLTAAQAGLDHYGKTGESGWSEAGKGVFGMEEGMAHSINNIATGNATWQDIAGIALLGSPVHEAVKEEPKTKGEDAPKTEDPIKNTTLAEPEPIKQKADGEAFEAEPEKTLEQKIIESQIARDNAISDYNNLGKEFQSKTVARDGIKTLSGWKKTPENFTEVNPEKVKSYSDEIGHEPKKAGAMDQKNNGGFDGKYNCSHAEKKVLTKNPNDPTGVSREMCSDCQSFAQKQAITTGKDVIVSDPNGTHIFKPNGMVIFIPK